MKRVKPLIFWLFAMEDYQREAVVESTDYFNKKGVAFITIDFSENKSEFVISVYNMGDDCKPFIDKIYRQISKKNNIGRICKNVGVLNCQR